MTSYPRQRLAFRERLRASGNAPAAWAAYLAFEREHARAQPRQAALLTNVYLEATRALPLRAHTPGDAAVVAGVWADFVRLLL